MKIKKASSKSPSGTSVPGTIEEIDLGIPSKTGRGSSRAHLIVECPEELVDRILELSEKAESAVGPLEIAKGDFTGKYAWPQHWIKNEGNMRPSSSMIARGKTGAIRFTAQDKFIAGEKAAIENLLRHDPAALTNFHQRVSLNIKLELIPPPQRTPFYLELKALMKRKGISSALEVKDRIVPIKGFAKNRHHIFNPEMNAKIHEIVKEISMVATKGVK